MLESLKLLQEKSSADAFNTHVLPMVYGALLSSHPQVQDRALQAVPLIARSIGPRDLREGLLPRVQHVYSKANILSHKVRALICLHGMLSALDRTSIVEKIMPQLKRTKTREPAVVMAMLSMYEEIGLKHLDRQLVATEIIPVLWAQSVDERLRVPQFDRFMQVIGKLSDRVRTEHRRHMETIQRVDVQAAAVEELFISDTPEGTAGDSSNGSFEAIVKGQASLCNPLAGLPVSQNTPGWEWDAPATNEQPLPGGILKETRVEVDLMGSSSLDVMNGRHAAGPAADINGDDFGSFSSFIPPPKPPPGKQPVAS
ncbi:Protein kinase domain-containing protein ppk32, partial [Coemansia biformis]